MGSNEQVRRLLRQHLESLQNAGMQTIPKATGVLDIVLPATDDGATASEPTDPSAASATPPTLVKVPAQSVIGAAPTAPAIEQPTPQVSPALASVSLALDQKPAALSVIQAEVANCKSCEALCDSRKQTVFGVGDPNARLVFVGEGPGADEDRVGEPFVGAAGQLLDKIIAACTLKREEVYILNTVKCRPPGNRNPAETELANCWPFGIRQLEVIQPEFICCLGSVAAKTVLSTELSIGKLRGQFHDFRSSKVLVTYHPAYLLRTPSAKKKVWDDMKMLMSEMGVKL